MPLGYSAPQPSMLRLPRAPRGYAPSPGGLVPPEYQTAAQRFANARLPGIPTQPSGGDIYSGSRSTTPGNIDRPYLSSNDANYAGYIPPAAGSIMAQLQSGTIKPPTGGLQSAMPAAGYGALQGRTKWAGAGALAAAGDAGQPAAAAGPPPGMDPLDWLNEAIRGKFPGDPGYDEAMQEFNNRKAYIEEHDLGGGNGQQPPGPRPDDTRTNPPPVVGGPGQGPGGVNEPPTPNPTVPPPVIERPPVLDEDPNYGRPPTIPPTQPPPRTDPGGTLPPPNIPGSGPVQNPPGGTGGAGGAGGAGGGGGTVPPFPQPTTGTLPPVFPNTGSGGQPNTAFLTQLFEDYQRANREGRAANENRYNDLINFLNQRYTRGLANLQGAGDQALSDVNRDYERMAANQDQDLISRGLRNSTVRQSVQRGVEDDRQAARNRILEDVRKERAQTDAVLSGDVLSAMERRTDEYPDQNQLLQLALALGGAGYYPYATGGGQAQQQQPWINNPTGAGGLVRNPNYAGSYGNIYR